MDIEEENQPNGQVPKHSPSKIIAKHSIKSRMSNDSMFSFPEMEKYQERSYPEKISLESNVSEKMRLQQNEKGLFHQLISQDAEFWTPNRTYGSNANDYRSYRMSEERSSLHHNEVIEDGNIQKEMARMSIEENADQPQKNQSPPEKIICKCSKSKCLLMYCECFSKGLICNQQCSCYQCRNNPQFEDKRQKARQSVLQRDPNAFKNKLELVGGEQTELAYKRGCNCKKTKCFKKYCECFSAGVKCTYLCNCENCLNGGQNIYKQ